MTGAFASSRSVRSTCRALEFSPEERIVASREADPRLYFSASPGPAPLSPSPFFESSTPFRFSALASIVRINLRAAKWGKERCGRRRGLSAPITSVCFLPPKRLHKDGQRAQNNERRMDACVLHAISRDWYFSPGNLDSNRLGDDAYLRSSW